MRARSMVVIFQVMCLEHITIFAKNYLYRQPRSDLTLLSMIPIQRGCDQQVWKLSQYETYQVTWDGKDMAGNCKLNFRAENAYNVATQYRVCFRFLDYYIKDCYVKVRFSETAWMYPNYGHDTREYDCNDNMPIYQWCSGWNDEAWFSLQTFTVRLDGGRFTLEITAEANTSLSVAGCVGIVIGVLGGFVFIFVLVKVCSAKERREMNNARRIHLDNARMAMSHRRDPGRILLDSSASFSERIPFRTPPLHPPGRRLSTDSSPSPSSPLRFRGNSISLIEPLTPMDEGTTDVDISPPGYHTITPTAPTEDITDNPPPGYHTVTPTAPTEDITDNPPPSYSTVNPPPPQNGEMPPPSYEECMQYTIT